MIETDADAASEVSVEHVETLLGVVLPEDYCRFLKQNDGGGAIERNNGFDLRAGNITLIGDLFTARGGSYGIMENQSSFPIACLRTWWRSVRIRAATISVCVSMAKYGSVFYHSHNQDLPIASPIVDYDNLASLVPTFADFLGNLRPPRSDEVYHRKA